MGHDARTLKLTICSKTSSPMSHFTSALTHWIRFQSLRSKYRRESLKWLILVVGWQLNPIPRPSRYIASFEGEAPIVDVRVSQDVATPPPCPTWYSYRFFSSSEPWRAEVFYFKCPRFPSSAPSPGSWVVTPHLLLSGNGARWPMHNRFHHGLVMMSGGRQLAVTSDCQSLLLRRQVLLNLTWCHRVSDTIWIQSS